MATGNIKNDTAKDIATCQTFVQQDPGFDVTLKIGDDKLYAPKIFLAMASPVFARMFETGFREGGEMEVDLPGKKYNDMLLFLQCLHPRIKKQLTNDSVFKVLPLAHEYQVDALLEECKRVLMSYLEGIDTSKWLERCNLRSVRLGRKPENVHIVNVLQVTLYADLYELNAVTEKCVDLLKEAHSEHFLNKENFETLSLPTRYKIVKAALLRNEQTQKTM